MTLRITTLICATLLLPACGQPGNPVPVPEPADQPADSLTLTATQLEASGIELLTAGPAQISDSIELPGEIRVATNSESVVLSPVPALVISAPALLGQDVRQGDLLATLESRELADLQRSYLEARARARLAASAYAREASLWQERITPEQDYLTARSARAEADIAVAAGRAALLSYGISAKDLDMLSLEHPGNLARLTLRAPRGGRITARDLSPGQRVLPDQPLFTIADLTRLSAVVAASNGQLAGLANGQTARVTSASAGDTASGSGRLIAISPRLDADSRSAEVHIALAPGNNWRPGQFIKAGITRARTQVPVAVSSEALQTVDDKTVVFVLEAGRLVATPVGTGRQGDGQVEITSGLEAGRRYAARNSFVLKSELGKHAADHAH
ncbi:MAG: efflux RND transporter periplasmic adaptor subunit [Perlucidibaca sp.]